MTGEKVAFGFKTSNISFDKNGENEGKMDVKYKINSINFETFGGLSKAMKLC